MSSRTTRAKANSKAPSNTASSAPAKPQSVKSRQADDTTEPHVQVEKENRSVKGKVAGKGAGSNGSTKGKSKKGVAKAPQVFCTCKGEDDGTPMVYCGECKDWYHFSCVNLSEREAEDINVYICPSCSERTGLHSVMTWEGPDAVEEIESGPSSVSISVVSKPPNKKAKAPTPTETKEKPADQDVPEPEPEPASDSALDSEDDDYEEIRNSSRGKRRARRDSYVSESESSESSDRVGKHRLRVRSPVNKRKASQNEDGPPLKKSKSSNPLDDPTRKYCLGKLEEVFRDIYLRYPHVRSEDSTLTERKLEELSEEERNTILEGAKQFADDLEQCVFEIYSEPDKSGASSAGAKYKDRFRMLQFNLSKPDRTVIHKRIASAQITPKEISLMSSTDLANEEIKQSIKIAEQEALEHSILQKTSAPRAKITHKGFEDIEDVTGQSSIRERERQQEEEEERMERERIARTKAPQPRQRTASLSVPPESPVVPQSPWGAPPSVPLYGFASSGEMSSPLVSMQRPPLFLHTSSDLSLPEPELNLADLINIDDESSPADVPTVSPPPTSLSPSSAEPSGEIPPESALEPSSSVSEAGPSSLSKPSPISDAPPSATEPPKASAFDLNSLWSLPKPAPTAVDTSTPNTTALPPSDKVPSDMVIESLEEANDRDFDMFLEEKETTSPEALQTAFHNLPHVWSGQINMPLDSATPQETPVIARQMGGRPLESGSSLWRTLFPSDHMRIDGRVPVENSVKFLLQMRMNPTKELFAVAFSPATPDADSSFKNLSDFLIAKKRHGLVFPWGQRPKDHHPGREFYVIPLLSSDPLPDYMELLDDLKLPKVRLSNYLVGIWILNKGKLAPPFPLPPPPVTSTPPIPSSTASAAINNTSLPLLPTSLANLAATLPVDQNALAQEIASLTPEQMSLISRALASVPNVSLPTSTPVPAPTSIPPSNVAGFQVPVYTPTPQPWGSNPGPNFPLDNEYPNYERNGNQRGHEHHGERGDRGRRGRGRGRDRGGGEDFSSKPPADSGWPRKRNNNGPGGPPPLRRWGN